MYRKQISIILLGLFFLFLCGSPAFAKDKQNQQDEKSDLWLEAQLVTSYTLNEHLNPFKINVDVEKGVAHLSGSVDSSIERDLAVEIARSIDGIKEVKEDLTIEPETQPKKGKNEFAQGVEDATITAKVKYRLMLNKNISSYDIDVDTEDGVVTLNGKVDSDAKKDLAVKLAENTKSVKKVNNNLTVVDKKDLKQDKSGSSIGEKVDQWSQDIQDTWITAKAKSLLLVSDEAEGAVYSITTSNGTIKVTGTVRSNKQADEIQKILEDLQGVKKVDNKLTVRDQV